MNEDIKLVPFKMHANVYFIGNEKVSVHLIDTEAGLVLIDTGYPDMLEVVLSGINALGFDVKNVRHIFHSHGHIDHYGTTAKLSHISATLKTTSTSGIQIPKSNGKTT